MNIYVVTMYRNGMRREHSYVIGAYFDLQDAIIKGEVESLWRGHKYFPEVLEIEIDKEYVIDSPKVVCGNINPNSVY